MENECYVLAHTESAPQGWYIPPQIRVFKDNGEPRTFTSIDDAIAAAQEEKKGRPEQEIEVRTFNGRLSTYGEQVKRHCSYDVSEPIRKI